MTRQTTQALLAALLLGVCPAWSFAQQATPAPNTEQADAVADDADHADEEIESDIEIINGIPVNPELKKRIMESEEQLSVQELLDLANEVMQEQQEKEREAAAAQAAANDQAWMQEDPFGHLESEMGELVQDLDESDTAEQTQTQGKEVVRKMDVLIARLEQAASASSSASGQGPGQGQSGQANGNNPAQDSTLAPGPGGSGELGASGEGNNDFADLDPAQREAILRANEENQGLPAEYDALLAEYYQRLAAERALTAEEDDEPDTDESNGE